MFPRLQDHRRREMLAQPFPPVWLDYLRANVGHYARLSQAEQAKLRDDLRVMVAEKNWEGCGGLEMTEEIQVTVAAQASLLLLGWEHGEYSGVESILVYPTGYVASQQDRLWNSGNSVVTEAPSPRLGQATASGTIVLSWEAALSEGRDSHAPGSVVLHEFAHALDARDGAYDGVPRLPDEWLREEWAEVMSAEYDALVRAAQQSHPTLLNPYGATNAAEFFAVATECFFGRPRPMRDTHPRLYKTLRDFYRQDTAARPGGVT